MLSWLAKTDTNAAHATMVNTAIHRLTEDKVADRPSAISAINYQQVERARQ
jgi:hypothetical protein